MQKVFWIIIEYPSGRCFQLGLEPRSMDEVTRAIIWQNVGQGQFQNYIICKRIGPNNFKCINTSKEYTYENDCFTKKAWDDFLNTWD